MPTREHEIPLRIIQNQPAVIPVLLDQSLGYGVPWHTEVINTSSVLTNCDPKELNSDGAVLLRDGDRNVLAVVVERQHGRDDDKRFSWPAYLTTLRLRLKCPAVLIVLCPNESVARWCANPIPLGHPGFDLAPLTVSPTDMPLVVESARARVIPEVAVFSAHAHGNTDSRTLKALVDALDVTPERHRLFYYDYALSGLNEAARKELEGLMALETYPWQSDFARKYVGIGREEGHTEEAARNVLLFLDARGLTVTDEVRRRIESCTDLDTLHQWVRRAATVDRAEDLFA